MAVYHNVKEAKDGKKEMTAKEAAKRRKGAGDPAKGGAIEEEKKGSG